MLYERAILKGFEIKLSEGEEPKVQILRVGKFKHPQYGEFEITRQVLAEMKANFDNRVRGIDVAFDYFHDSDKAASGWPTDLFLTEGGDALWANVKWTNKARTMLAEREVRYFSPDFAFQWQDPETGQVFKNVLFGGGLTNRPFVKEMAAIVAAEEKNKMTLEQLKDQLKLAEEKGNAAEKKLEDMMPEMKSKDEAIASLKAELAALAAKIEALGKEKEAVLGEKVKLEEQIKCTEKEAAFNLLLTEGKACVAQKEAYMKGDMDAFIKLSAPVNVKAQGNGGGTTEASGDDFDDKVLKLAETKRKENASLSHGESLSLAIKELKTK